MAGNLAFCLKAADGRAGNVPLDRPPIADPPVVDDVAGLGAAASAPPRLPYAPDPGTFTLLCTSQSATMTAEEMKDEMDA
jgi:hypothetical protein